MTTTIKRLEDRQTGLVSYTLDDGSPQLLGERYDTRQAAEAALTAPPKTRTITMTDQPPVTIREDRWPIIAQAEHTRHDGGEFERQASRRTRAFLKVRQHADGRTLVYGGYDHTSCWHGETDHRLRRGVLLVADGNLVTAVRIVAAIHAVASDLPTGRDDDLAQECIADLPAVLL